VSIVVTGATGHLGRLVVENLLERGVDADHIVATGRRIEEIKDLADRGVPVRAVNYNDPTSLREAFAGAQQVLLISGTEIGQRVGQHQRVIDAAKDAGVGLLVYTSVANADSTTLQLAADHRATEAALRASGVPFALLRNSWYLENYTGQIETYLQHGVIFGAAGDVRISAAPRADYATAAAAVLSADGQAGMVYELGGDQAFTMAELAAQVSTATGQDVAYQDLTVEAYAQLLVDAGLPQAVAAMIADNDRGVAEGHLLVTSGDLSRLIGRPTASLADAVAAALR